MDGMLTAAEASAVVFRNVRRVSSVDFMLGIIAGNLMGDLAVLRGWPCGFPFGMSSRRLISCPASPGREAAKGTRFG
jgi:hypothetical protein